MRCWSYSLNSRHTDRQLQERYGQSLVHGHFICVVHLQIVAPRKTRYVRLPDIPADQDKCKLTFCTTFHLALRCTLRNLLQVPSEYHNHRRKRGRVGRYRPICYAVHALYSAYGTYCQTMASTPSGQFRSSRTQAFSSSTYQPAH